MPDPTDRRPRGHPVESIIPPILATPEKVARAIMQSPPKKKWEYRKKTSR